MSSVKECSHFYHKYGLFGCERPFGQGPCPLLRLDKNHVEIVESASGLSWKLHIPTLVCALNRQPLTVGRHYIPGYREYELLDSPTEETSNRKRN
jgi:hypothetical protein